MRNKKDNRLGEERIMNCGLKAKIIEYRSRRDIDIEFENGIIIKHRQYDAFLKGNIREPKQCENEKKKMSCGMMATIIAYHTNTNIDVKFEDGTIVTHRSYDAFQKGAIKNPNYRIGQINQMNCGMKAKIIRYQNNTDIDIEFEDGVIVKKRSYSSFLDGTIKHPNYCGGKRNDRLHETKIMKCGLKAKIIEYRNAMDIDIEFEDGTIAKHKMYYNFTKGKIPYPIQRLGEEKRMHCGLKAKIIEYRNNNDIDVKFENGIIVKNKNYHAFITGQIRCPINRLGEERIMNCGLRAKIIEYRKSTDIDIEFEDGTIIQHKMYGNFEKGTIRNPKIPPRSQEVIGDTRTMHCGMKATVIAYRKAMDIDIQFEDGTIVQHRQYGDFKKGKIQNPRLK